MLSHSATNMTQTIEFDPGKYFTPEQTMRLPLIAKERGFQSPDELLADLVKRDLFPSTPAKPTKKKARAAK